MGRRMRRMVVAIGVAGIAVALTWAGYWVLEAGREVMAIEARVPIEYFLGSHLIWLLSGTLVAAILDLGFRTNTRRPAKPALAAAIVPILILLPTYIWSNPTTPRWLRQEWFLSGEAQAAAAILAGVLLGAALWRRIHPIGSDSQ